jgi:hypothetical protein
LVIPNLLPPKPEDTQQEFVSELHNNKKIKTHELLKTTEIEENDNCVSDSV